jgi:hypothetical protein
MLADIGTAAVIVVVVLIATLLPMYAKWRAMQALVGRLARRSAAGAQRQPPADEEPRMHERLKDSRDRSP